MSSTGQERQNRDTHAGMILLRASSELSPPQVPSNNCTSRKRMYREHITGFVLMRPLDLFRLSTQRG
ncbi:hypothetical protein CDAR_317381, partial [Caerostris darwini]